MSTIRSGFSDANIANQEAASAPPSPPVDFVVVETGLQDTEPPDELALVTFGWTAPATSDLSLEEALTDDQYDFGSAYGVVDGDHQTNDTDIYTVDSMVPYLTPGRRILFGSDPTRYIVESVTPDYVRVLYGLQAVAPNGAVIKRLSKLAESPIDSRQFRVNAKVGVSINVYHESGIEKSKWTAGSALGEWEDLNKVLVEIDEAARQWSAERVIGIGPLVLAEDAAASETILTVSEDPTGLVDPGDSIGFGDPDDLFYPVDSISATPYEIVLGAALDEGVAAGAPIWLHLSPYSFPDYRTAPLNEFTAETSIDDLGGYKLYAKDSTATPGDLGDLVETIQADDEGLSVVGGQTQYAWSAPDGTYDGREIFFSLVAYDQEMPTANESDPALNASTITYPGQAHITVFTEDRPNSQAIVEYEQITQRGDGSNTHLLEVMNQATAQYSLRGGYDIYVTEMAELPSAAGTYEGVSETSARYLHGTILEGDQIRIVDSMTRHEWTAQATADGQVDFDDSKLRRGDAGSDYLTDHSQANITAHRCAVDRDTDSVIPYDMATPATPQKQYLTDFTNTATVQFPDLAVYSVTIESIDTEA